MKVLAFFKNRYVLYITVVLGVANLLGYIAMENYNSMALLVVMFLLSRYFSKNVAVNICIAILVTSFVTLNNKITEGLEGTPATAGGTRLSRSSTEERPPSIAISDTRQINLPQTDTVVALSKARLPTPPDSVIVQNPEDEENPIKPVEPEPEPEPVPEPEPEPELGECPEGTELVEGECQPLRRGFRNNVPSSKPAKINNSEDDDMDVAAKMEDAYGNLNKMLGDGAMKSMANETKKLVVQQQELMNTLSTMTPALNKAKETLENLNLPNMEEMTGILKKFTQ